MVEVDLSVRACDNPFRVQRLEALEFRDEFGRSGRSLAADWLRQSRHGAIVGPRGTGKSTLLRAVANVAREGGFGVRHVQLRRESGRVRGSVQPLLSVPPHSGEVVLVDSAGCLTWPALWRLAFACRRAGCALFTAHYRTGLPTVARTRSSPRLLRALLEELGHESAAQGAHSEELVRRHRGNLREVFRSLYDEAAGAAPDANAAGAPVVPM